MALQQSGSRLQRRGLLSLVHTAAQSLEQRILNLPGCDALAAPDDLRRGKPPQLRRHPCHSLRPLGSGGIKRAGGQVAEAQTIGPVQAEEAGHVIVAALVQHRALGDGAGGDNPDNVPVYQSLGRGRVLGLLTNGHLVPLGHQPGNVGLGGVVGHAAHGGLVLLVLAPVPGGQGQVQLFGHQLGILIEHLIEITQTEKQEAILVFLFHLQVLPHHRGQLCGHMFSHFLMFQLGQLTPPPRYRSGSRWWRHRFSPGRTGQ